jgi:predicted metal-dependent phosphoesterase TrpH
VSPEFAISSIIKSGGIPILAHPGATVYSDDYKTIVEIMFKKGIKGIECFHPENNVEITDYCVDFSKKNKLYITGGSDCHGDFLEARLLGKPEIWKNQIKIGNLLNKFL